MSKAQPEGLQESSRWSESAETTGNVADELRELLKDAGVEFDEKYLFCDLAPPGCGQE